MQPNAQNRHVPMSSAASEQRTRNVRLKVKRAHAALCCASRPCQLVPACRSFKCKGLVRCPLGSCDCAKAERRVQRAAALKGNLSSFALQTGSCLPESGFRDRRRQEAREIYVGERGWNRGARKKQACDSCRCGSAAKHFYFFLALGCR